MLLLVFVLLILNAVMKSVDKRKFLDMLKETDEANVVSLKSS